MVNQGITEQQALLLLKKWISVGRELPSLAKFETSNNNHAVLLFLPGYICNQWYQVGNEFKCYTEAMSYLGMLIDKSYKYKH